MRTPPCHCINIRHLRDTFRRIEYILASAVEKVNLFAFFSAWCRYLFDKRPHNNQSDQHLRVFMLSCEPLQHVKQAWEFAWNPISWYPLVTQRICTHTHTHNHMHMMPNREVTTFCAVTYLLTTLAATCGIFSALAL